MVSIIKTDNKLNQFKLVNLNLINFLSQIQVEF